MRIYLAGTESRPYLLENWNKEFKPYVLMSYVYCRNKDIKPILENAGDVLIDSGAFTIREKTNKEIKYEEYLEQYADFIVKNNIKKFFELDIDSIVGYEKVKYYRTKLETLTNRPCIPVWHINRGKEDFIQTCENYGYVALGGIASYQDRTRNKKYIESFPWFIREAHKRNCKIHGLGITEYKTIKKCHFDSVDSTTWLAPTKYGQPMMFDGKRMILIQKPPNTKLKHYKGIEEIEFAEWVKFQEYAEEHL